MLFGVDVSNHALALQESIFIDKPSRSFCNFFVWGLISAINMSFMFVDLDSQLQGEHVGEPCQGC